jgi:hypothetical protein
METWLTTIAPRVFAAPHWRAPTRRRSARGSPRLGKQRLDRLAPERIERFYTLLKAEGLVTGVAGYGTFAAER